MTWEQALLSLAMTLTSAVVGGLIVHFLALRRDTHNSGETLNRDVQIRAREKRTEYLTKAYSDITLYHSLYSAPKFVEKPEHEEWRQIEENFNNSINNLMLFGTSKQITVLSAAMNRMRDTNKLELDELLTGLRNELRLELGLEPISNPHMEMRIIKHREKK